MTPSMRMKTKGFSCSVGMCSLSCGPVVELCAAMTTVDRYLIHKHNSEQNEVVHKVIPTAELHFKMPRQKYSVLRGVLR